MASLYIAARKLPGSTTVQSMFRPSIDVGDRTGFFNITNGYRQISWWPHYICHNVCGTLTVEGLLGKGLTSAPVSAVTILGFSWNMLYGGVNPPVNRCTGSRTMSLKPSNWVNLTVSSQCSKGLSWKITMRRRLVTPTKICPSYGFWYHVQAN